VHLLLWLLLAFVPRPPAAPADSLLIDVTGRVTVLRAPDLAALPHDSARWPYRGVPHTYTGIRLVVLLKRVGLPMDSLHGSDLTKRVVVEAADRYRAVFTLAEISPGIGSREVLVADAEDGHPLPPSVGRWRLVVPGDRGGVRAVREVVALRVRDET